MAHILVKSFGINKLIGSTFLSIICFFLLIQNIKKITKINNIIIPILIIFIVYIGIKNLTIINIFKIGLNTTTDNSIFWVIDAILYSSYNLILLIPVIINLGQFIKNKRHILITSILVGVIISIISVLIFFLLINVDVNFSTLEMPVVYVIKNRFSRISIIYGTIILIAIFSTAISVGIAFLNNICKEKHRYPQIAAIMCISSVGFSVFGFSNLVKVIFPLFGYLGIIQMYRILKKQIRC